MQISKREQSIAIIKQKDSKIQFRRNFHEDGSETYDLVIRQDGKVIEINCTSHSQARDIQEHLVDCGFEYVNDIIFKY